MSIRYHLVSGNAKPILHCVADWLYWQRGSSCKVLTCLGNLESLDRPNHLCSPHCFTKVLIRFRRT